VEVAVAIEKEEKDKAEKEAEIEKVKNGERAKSENFEPGMKDDRGAGNIAFKTGKKKKGWRKRGRMKK